MHINSKYKKKATLFSKSLAILMLIVLVSYSFLNTKPVHAEGSSGVQGTVSKAEATYAKAGELTGLTSKEIVDDMGFGWNLGNTFDATGGNKSNIYSQETSWGNPKVTPELIKAVHDRGFKTIRIPVTWNNHISKDGTYTINPEFMARVKEVVDYAYDLNMYIIINLHHEAWLNVATLSPNVINIGVELEAVWKQIADCFADYDQHLIFEAMNEPRLAGTDIEWTGNQEAYKAINYLNQVFAFTVRNSGKGHNDERCLMIPGYAASNSPDVLKSITIPTFEGKTVKNIIISTHCYNPYNFCLSDQQREFNPKNKNHTASIDSVFKNLEEIFLFNDIPVVIGETSATEKNNTDQRENWAEYMGRKSYEYGIPIILWDNGANGHSGGECHAWILRNKCEWNYKTVVDKLFSAAQSIDWGERTITDKLAHDSLAEKQSILGGDVIWEDKKGHTVAGQLYSHAQPISIPVIRYYIKSTSELAILYSGSGTPQFSIELPDKGIVSGAISPDRTESFKDKKVAYFKYRTINDTLTEAGIRNVSDSIMYIFSDGPDTDIFEVDVMDLKPEVTYMVCGQSFTSESSVSVPKGMRVLGWYTTIDYQDGTEYNGESGKKLTVYAKLFWEQDAKAMALYNKKSDNNSIPTEEITSAPTKGAEDNADSGKNTDNNMSDNNEVSSDPNDNNNINNSNTINNEESGSNVLIIILIIVGAVLIISVTLLILFKKSNKAKKSK